MTGSPGSEDDVRPPAISLGALFLRFLGFGLNAFGGPVAQIAMIRRELVERERWVSPERFHRLLGVMQALPGPEAHELCVHLGVSARGRIGGLLAGLGFMLPGVVLMLGLAWAYARLNLGGGVASPVMWAVQAAALALVARGLWGIGRHAVTGGFALALATVAGGATAFGAPFWLVLPLGGTAMALRASGRGSLGWAALVLIAASGLWPGDGVPGGWASRAPQAPSVGDPVSVGVWTLFIAGLKAGLLTFGGAYAAIPFLKEDAVGGGWVAETRFLDGVALAGVLPAPLIVFATFVGVLAGGLNGGLAITAGVFLPAFAFSIVLYERLEAVVERPGLHAFLDGVTAAVVGLIAVTLLDLGVAALAPPRPTALLALVAVAALMAVTTLKRRWVTPAVLIAAGLFGWGALRAG